MAVLRMPFFNRSVDPQHAAVRPALPQDAAALRSLARRAQWSYFTGATDEVVDLLRTDPTVVLLDNDQIVAAAQAGWRMPPNAWLRTVLVDRNLDVEAALRRLSPTLGSMLPSVGITAVFVTLDDWSDPWLRAPLEAIGFIWVMDVWGYAKRRLDIPSFGNSSVVVRAAGVHDLQRVLVVDKLCFPTPWAKGSEILEPAITSSPHFAVAELDGEIVGYSYVSLHGSWQAHLVRIAVVPAAQGSGVGVRLLADVVRFCRHRRIELLTLNTQAANTQAQRLYEWFGFERTGDVQRVYGRSDDGV